jgi:hypothetical protein
MLGCAAERGDELIRIRALATRRGQEDVERLDAAAPRDRAELSGSLRRSGDARLGDAAGALDLLAEREPDASLLERNDRSVLDPRNQQTTRVGPDVDDPDGHVRPS